MAAGAAPAGGDAGTVGAEATDDDPAAVRIHIRTANVDFLEQAFARRKKMSDDRVGHRPGSWRLLAQSEESLLFRPRLAGRVRDRRLADELPLCLALVLGEGLLIVPILLVEQALALGNLPFGLKDREGEHRDENVRFLALLERRLAERNLRKGCGLLPRGVYPEVADRFLDTEHIASHDLTGTLLARRRFESSVADEPHHFRGKVVTLRVDDSLGEFVGEASGFELQKHFVLLMHRQGTAHDCCFHRIPPVVYGNLLRSLAQRSLAQHETSV